MLPGTPPITPHTTLQKRGFGMADSLVHDVLPKTSEIVPNIGPSLTEKALNYTFIDSFSFATRIFLASGGEEGGEAVFDNNDNCGHCCARTPFREAALKFDLRKRPPASRIRND